jgi:hypothetical protein
MDTSCVGGGLVKNYVHNGVLHTLYFNGTSWEIATLEDINLTTHGSVSNVLSSLVNGVVFIGGLDATGDLSQLADAKNGDYWIVNVAGTFEGIVMSVNDRVVCNTDVSGTPTDFSNFSHFPSNIDVMIGASETTDGAVGLVTKPVAGDEDLTLHGDGTWSRPYTLVTQKNDNIGINNADPLYKLDVGGSVNTSTSYLFDGTNALTLSKGSTDTYYSSIFIGDGAGNGSAHRQVVVGRRAGFLGTGSYQAAFGGYAGYRNTGDYQAALGSHAGYLNTGALNTSLGAYASYQNSGARVLGLGYEAARDNSGNDVVAIGYEAGQDNALNNQFIVKQANINTTPLIQGDFSSGNIGIGETSPTTKLHVTGTDPTVRVESQTNGNPKFVLSEDENNSFTFEYDGSGIGSTGNLFRIGSYWQDTIVEILGNGNTEVNASVSARSFATKVYNPATGKFGTVASNTEYLSPNQYGGIFGTVYMQYFSGSTLPTSLTSGGNVAILVDYLVHYQFTNGMEGVARGYTTARGTADYTVNIGRNPTSSNLFMETIDYTVIRGIVYYTKN